MTPEQTKRIIALFDKIGCPTWEDDAGYVRTLKWIPLMSLPKEGYWIGTTKEHHRPCTCADVAVAQAIIEKHLTDWLDNQDIRVTACKAVGWKREWVITAVDRRSIDHNRIWCDSNEWYRVAHGSRHKGMAAFFPSRFEALIAAAEAAKGTET